MKQFEVFFEGKILVEAETEAEATQEAYDELNNGRLSFSITGTEEIGEVEA